MSASEIASDEADRQQLRLAEAAGDTYQRALSYMVEQVADNGARQEHGDYVIAIAQERAEGMYGLDEAGELVWQGPGAHNCHLEVSVSDAGDHRFVPGLDIAVTLRSPSGDRLGPFEMPFLWHPGLYHYGRNITVPDAGAYTITVAIEPPTFMRHDRKNGRRYSKRVEVDFTDFNITPGRE